MPLYDHFRPPLSERRPWESFHSTWCTSIADYLNRHVLPTGYIALEQVHSGAAIEIDVGTFAEEHDNTTGGGTATLTKTAWTPTTAPLTFDADYLEQFTVEVYSNEGGRTLVAALEMVSPGNKDRESKRRLFAAKCATYLARGLGLVMLDVVTSRQANLHNELAGLLALETELRMAETASPYAVAYRPLQCDEKSWIDCWPMTFTVGDTLPSVPLSLAAELCLKLDLEATYVDACERRRLDEVVT